MTDERFIRSRIRWLWLLVLLSPLIARADAPATTQATYTNPLNVDVADPFIIRHDGVYWLYGTSSREGFKSWCSNDLVHWELKGLAFQRTQQSWGVAMFWAPCVVERDGTFYLYYSALGDVPGGKQHLRICVATSDSPGGPFKDAKAPLLELTYNWDAEKYGEGRNFGHLAFEVDDIYATCDRLMKAGVTINRPPRDGRMAFIRSPDNISIELLQHGAALPPAEPWKSMPNTGAW